MRPRSSNEIETGTVEIGYGQTVPYELVKMARRKHAHLLVCESGIVQLRAPLWFTTAMAREEVRRHSAWLLSKRDRVLAAARRRPRLTTGAELPLLGETLSLEVVLDAQLSLPLNLEEARATRRCAWVERRGSKLYASVDEMGEAALATLLERWFRDAAGALLPERLGYYAGVLGLYPAKVRIASQRSRWGSCSARRTISLNWRLVLLSPRLADYVLVHELCHLAHMNHSPRFWALVASVVPDHRARRKELRTVQAALPL